MKRKRVTTVRDTSESTFQVLVDWQQSNIATDLEKDPTETGTCRKPVSQRVSC